LTFIRSAEKNYKCNHMESSRFNTDLALKKFTCWSAVFGIPLFTATTEQFPARSTFLRLPLHQRAADLASQVCLDEGVYEKEVLSAFDKFGSQLLHLNS
jgi:hypothetical protein